MKLIILLVFIFSCASQKVVIQGYSEPVLSKALARIQGKSPEIALKLLGRPAIHGVCKTCGKGKTDIYRIIYLDKDRDKFYLEITYNTDAEVDCIVLDFEQDKAKNFLFDKKKGFKPGKNCNQKGGAILQFKEILELQSSTSSP